MDPATTGADGPPPDLGLQWPSVERLAGTAVVVSRPEPALAPDVYRLVADPALWIDVPVAARTTSVAAQRDDLERIDAHWATHGFGYWLAWSGSAADAPTDAVGGDLLGLGGLRWLWWRDDWVLNVYVRLAARAHGRGLARRMLASAITRLHEAVTSPTTVVVRTRPTNTAMAGLAHRLGFDEAGDEERAVGTYRVLARTIGLVSTVEDRSHPVVGPDGVRAADDAVRGMRAGHGVAPVLRLRRGGPLVLDDALPVRRGHVVDGTVAVGAALLAPADDKPGRVVCRCGRSGIRPWCDASHRRAADRAADRVGADVTGTTPPTVAWDADDPGLPDGVVVVDDGPVVVVGLPVVVDDRTVGPSPTGLALCCCDRVPDGWCDGGCPAGTVVRRHDDR